MDLFCGLTESDLRTEIGGSLMTHREYNRRVGIPMVEGFVDCFRFDFPGQTIVPQSHSLQECQLAQADNLKLADSWGRG